MKLGKQVYRNKLNGELYREIIASNMPFCITLNEENIYKLRGGVRFFQSVKNQNDPLVVSHSEFATFIEETDYDLVEAYKCMR